MAAIIEKFGFDEPQAAAIVAYRIGQLAGLEIKKILEERDELRRKIEEYLEILGSEERVLSIVKDELSAVGDKFADPPPHGNCQRLGAKSILKI